MDEAVTYDMAHRPLPVLWATLGNNDAVHGLYYLLMHGVFSLWEGGVVALRLPSAIAMACAASGVAALGRRLAGPRAGLVAGVVFALLPAVQRYAQEGRSYALVTALVVASSWVLLKGCTRPRPATWAGYGVLVALSILLHEFAVLALAAHGATLLAARVPWTVARAWAAVACCAAAIASPLVWLSMRQSQQIAWIELSLTGDVAGLALLAVAGVGCAALVTRFSARGPGVRQASLSLPTLALPLLVVPPGLLLLVSVVKPLYVDRYVLYAQAGLALLAGAALETLWRLLHRRRGMVLAVVAAAVLAVEAPLATHLRSPASRTDDVTAISRVVEQMAGPGDGVLFLPSSRRVWMVQRTPASLGLVDLTLAASPRDARNLYGTEVSPAVMRQRMSRVSRVVVLREPVREREESSEGEKAKQRLLEQWFTPCGGRELRTARIEVHARDGYC
ncbi:glycosyltransferase family 39 protein [Streptomyces sp. NPDC091292]|uniref:glycosyltransferase family 39 protein n=1 Tax=Streptomyces sp. NPDC091292 TaxID=3365991 RepID=UPI0038250827